MLLAWGEFLFFIVVLYIIFILKSYDDVKPVFQFSHDGAVESKNFSGYKRMLYLYITTTRMVRMRLLIAAISLFMTSYMPASLTRFGHTVAHFYDHALLAYLTSLSLWITFPFISMVAPCFSLGRWIVPIQIFISLTYGIALALFVSIFYTVPKSEIIQLIVFSAISLLMLAADAD
jgi:hypothetical protein